MFCHVQSTSSVSLVMSDVPILRHFKHDSCVENLVTSGVVQRPQRGATGKWLSFLSQDMHEVYKVLITVTLLVVLSFFLTKTLAVSSILVALALIYHFDFECYPPQRRLTNKVIKFSLKVRNSKINDVFSNGGTMQNNSNSGLWLRSGYSVFSPNSSRKMEPQITSTPIPRLHQRREPLLTPRPATGRYSLSDMSMSQTVTEKERSRPSPVQNTSGPLLASTRYHNNIGTYMDSKSPGFSSRIVQYSKEAEHQPTHQAKYGRPGVFPVVHLFKKDKSSSPKPKTVTLRFAPSDTIPHYSPEHSRLLLNGAFKDPHPNKSTPFLQNSVVTSPATPENDISTRSVLDALKEISRKRIHTNEDLEQTLDPCKKQKKDAILKEQYQKRAREESPPDDSLAKRSCFVVDPVVASATSSQRYRQQLEKGLKRKETSQNNQKEKVLKLNQDIETQTRTKEAITSPLTTATLVPPAVEKATSTDNIIEEKKKEEEEETSWVQVFDDRPLAEARKNRLAKMLGSLTGKKPYIEPPRDKTETFASRKRREEEEKKKKEEEERQKKEEEKKLVSILSPPNKTKHDKHVTFNIPTITTSVESIVSSSSLVTSAVSVTPLSVSESKEKTSSTLSDPFVFSGSKTSTVTAVLSPVTTSLPLPINASSSTTSTTVTTPTFSFGKPVSSTSVIPSSTITTTTTTPPKIGGFKFDLISSASSPAAIPKVSSSPVITSANDFKISSSNTFTISSPKKDDSPKSIVSGFKLPTNLSFTSSPSSSVGAIPTFGVNTTTVAPIASVSSSSNTTMPSAFGVNVATTTSSELGSGGFNFNKSVSASTTTAVTTKSFAFGVNQSSSSIPKNLFPSSSTTTTTAVTTTASFSFTAAPLATSPSTVGFGLTKTTSIFSVPSTFGQDQSLPTFGTAISTAPATAAATTTTSSFLAFNTTKTTAPSIFANTPNTTSSTNVFGSTTPTFGAVATTSSTPIFGVPTTSATFGAVTTASSIPTFLPPTTSATSVFGMPAPSAPVFGATTTSIPAFGSTFGGSTTSTPAFGATTTTTSASVFGVPTTTKSTPIFGSPFASPTTTAVPLFSNTAPVFGATSAAITTTDATKPTNLFSSGSSQNFGTNQAFGGFGTSGSGFGTAPAAPPAFGTVTSGFTTSKQDAPKAFGIPSTPTFGGPAEKTPNAFGGGSVGGNTPTFGGFSSTSSKTAFGASNTQSSNMFGSTIPFASNNNNQSGFASNTDQSNPTFSFGTAANNNSAKPAAFSFGSNTEPPPPGSFNFGATAAPTFGTSTPTFGGNFNPQFNAPAAGTFSIGSGSTPNRSRTTLRAKRRN